MASADGLEGALTPRKISAVRPGRSAVLEGHAARLPAVSVAGVDLWRIDLDRPIPGALELLTAGERLRADRFVFDRDRVRFVAGRAAQRVILAGYAGGAPEALVFDLGPRGKPHLTTGPPFSYSNSGSCGLLAAGGDRPLGVDVERIREVSDASAVGRSVFTPEEWAAWRAAGGDPCSGFLRVWTQKEAVLKALGLGLGGMETVTAERRAAVAVFDVDLDPDHVAALAVLRNRA
jgi:4'-phosphopantetheinyl transferase